MEQNKSAQRKEGRKEGNEAKRAEGQGTAENQPLLRPQKSQTSKCDLDVGLRAWQAACHTVT